jgi:hypothetical protein
MYFSRPPRFIRDLSLMYLGGRGIFTLQTDEWCVHNRLINAKFEVKFKKTPDIYFVNLSLKSRFNSR